MKKPPGVIIVIFAFLIISSCGRGSRNNDPLTANDTLCVVDTGFTGIKQYRSGNQISVEATFKNGVKEGLTKMYYLSGNLSHTSFYRNGLKEDTGKWYYEEGQLFRATPYKRDTIDGIQIQYYRTGNLKAKIGYKKGLRTFFIQEFDMNGKLLSSYPQLIVKIRDDYDKKGMYTLSLGLSDKAAEVKYYRGDFGNGVFDTTRSVQINTINRIGTLNLKKTGTPQTDSVDFLASIRTLHGNNYLVHKKLGLPYKDLR